MPIYINKKDYDLSKSKLNLSSAQKYGGGIKFGSTQEELKTQNQLTKDINLMIQRKEPLDKIARELKIDYDTLKKSVEELQPNYAKMASERDKNWFERNITWSLPKKIVWDTFIKEGIIDPISYTFDSTQKTRKAFFASREQNKRIKQFEERQKERKRLFGDITDEQYKDKAFTDKLKAFDAETKKILTPSNKVLEYEKKVLDDFQKVDATKYAFSAAETFLTLSLFGLGGKTLVKSGAKAGAPSITQIFAKAGTPTRKILATELAKEVPIGAAYGALYQGRTKGKDVTGKDLLTGATIGGAIGIPSAGISTLLIRHSNVKTLQKLKDKAVNEGTKAYTDAFQAQLTSMVNGGAITKAEAKKIYTAGIKTIRKNITDFVENEATRYQKFVNSIPKNVKNKIVKGKLSTQEALDLLDDRQLAALNKATGVLAQEDFATGQLGVSRTVSQESAIQAANRVATEAVTTGALSDTAAAAIANAGTDVNAVVRSLNDAIAEIESIPTATRTPAQTATLDNLNTQVQAITTAPAQEAVTTPFPIPQPATTPAAAVAAPQPVQPTARPTVAGRTPTPEEVPQQRLQRLVEQKAITQEERDMFNKVVDRISQLQVSLEKMKMIADQNLTPAQRASMKAVEKALDALRQNPSYKKTISALANLDTQITREQVQTVAEEAYRLTRDNGGVTINLQGNKPAEGYAYAPNKGTEKVVAQAKFTSKDIEEFIDDNIDELVKDGNHVGMWVEDGNVYMDISQVGAPTAETLAKAQAAEQLAVFDLKEFKQIDTGKIDPNGVYIKIDEATNIYSKYQGEIKATAQEGAVAGVPEVSEGAPAVSGAGKEQVSEVVPEGTQKAPDGEIVEKVDSELAKELFDDIKVEDKINSGVLDKLNKFVVDKAADILEPVASSAVGSRVRDAFNKVQIKIQNSTAPLLRPIEKAEREGVLPEGTYRKIATFIRDVKSSVQEAETFMINNDNWKQVVAPVDGKALSGKKLKDLNKYIEARTELNLMDIDKVDNPGRREMFENTVKALESDDFANRFDALVKYNDELLDMLVDEGIVSKQKATMWRSQNEQYIRVQREIEDLSTRNVIGGGGKGVASIRTTAAEQRRYGSTKEMRDIIQTSAERTRNVYHEINKNRAATALIDAYKAIGQELADPIRTAENVIARATLRESLALSKPVKTSFERFFKTQRRYTARIESELNQLNREGLESYLKTGARDKSPIELRTKIRVLREVDPDLPLTALKEEGRWNTGSVPDISAVRNEMANTRYWNNVTNEPSEALLLYAKANDYTPDEALVKQYMKARKFDGYEYNGKEFIVNDNKLGRKAGDMLMKQEIAGKVKKVTTTDKKMGRTNTVNAVENLISYPTSELNNIRRKISRREPKLAEAIDELINIKTELENINATRRAEWEQIMAKADKDIAGNPTIARRVDGVDEVYVTLPEIETAAKGWGRVPMEAWVRAMNAPVRALKTTLTGALNPAYAIKAAFRDPIESFVLSPTARATHSPQNIMGSLAEAAGKSDLFKKFLETEGGSASYIDFIRKPRDAAALIRQQSRLQMPSFKRKASLVKNPADLWREFEDASRYQEQFSRFMNFKGAYNDAIKRGLNESDALIEARWAARNNQVDFFKTGDWSQVLNALFPYFNSSVQAGARLGRAFKTKPVTTSMKVIGAIQIPSAIVAMYNLSDPRRAEKYLDIPEYERENNWIFILPGSEKTNGRWQTIKFPKPPGVGAFSVPVENMAIGMYGYDASQFADFVQAMFRAGGSPISVESPSAAVGSIIPQAAKPLVQSVANYDFFTGKAIIPTWLKEQEPDPFNQKFDTTSATATSIAKLLNISPLLAEKFLQDSFGTFGKTALYELDTLTQGAGASGIGGKSPAKTFTEIFSTSPGGVVDRQVKSQLDTVINTKSKQSSLVTDNILLNNLAEANRIANEYNQSIDDLMDTIYEKPEFTSVSTSQIKYLESLKFPMENGKLKESSIKARLKYQ